MTPDSLSPAGSGFDLGSVPNLAPDTGIKEQLSGENGQFVGPSSRWEQFSEAARWNFLNGPTAALERRASEFGAAQAASSRGALKESAQKLNERFKDSGVTFTDDEYADVAELRVAQRRRELEVNDYIGRGKQFGFGWGLLAGTPQVLDPTNIAANIFGGAAIGGTLAKTGLGTFNRLMIENTLTNLAVDVPTYRQQKSEGSDVTIGQTVAGSVVGAAIGSTIGAFFHNRAVRKFEEKLNSVKEGAVNQGINQHENGVKVNPEKQLFLGDALVNGETDAASGVTPTGYAPVGHASEVPIFVTKNNGTLISTGEHGPAVYGSDSAYAENNKGSFSQVQVSPDAKILNTHDRLDAPDAEVFKMAVEMKLDRFGVKPIEMKDGATVQDLIHRLQIEEDAGNLPEGATAQSIVREVAKDLQIDGMGSVHAVNGNPRYNKVAIFNESKLSEVGFFQQNDALRPKADPDQIAREHAEYVQQMQNKELYDLETIQELDHLKNKPEMTPEEVKTFIKQQEIRTRADLKKLLAKSEEQLDLISDTKQGELGIGEGRAESTGAIEDLQATQALYDDVMAQIDAFIESDNFGQVVKRISDDELGRMKQAEIEGLRGTATQKPTFRRSNLPDKDTLARMSAEEYRSSIQSFADDQPELFAVHYYGVQQELELQALPPLKTGPRGRVMTSDEMGKLYLAIQQSLPFADGAPKKVVIPPEAPTPQTRKLIGGVAGDGASKNKADVEIASEKLKNITPSVLSDATEEVKAQIKNHEMTDKTRKMIEDKIAQIDSEYEAEMQQTRAKETVIDCMAVGVT